MKRLFISTLMVLSLTFMIFGWLAFAQQYQPQPPPRVEVQPPAPPPQLRVEIPGTAPSPDYVWIPGYWDWNGHDYLWISGKWMELPAPKVTWVPGHWEWNGYNYVWTSGYWSQ